MMQNDDKYVRLFYTSPILARHGEADVSQGLEAWHEDPSKFLGRPCLPKYKDNQHGRNILIYDIQALSKPGLKLGGSRL
jgi:hypothetical protein